MAPWLAAVIVTVLAVASVALIDAVHLWERNVSLSWRARIVLGLWFLVSLGVCAFAVIPHDG